ARNAGEARRDGLAAGGSGGLGGGLGGGGFAVDQRFERALGIGVGAHGRQIGGHHRLLFGRGHDDAGLRHGGREGGNGGDRIASGQGRGGGDLQRCRFQQRHGREARGDHFGGIERSAALGR